MTWFCANDCGHTFPRQVDKGTVCLTCTALAEAEQHWRDAEDERAENAALTAELAKVRSELETANAELSELRAIKRTDKGWCDTEPCPALQRAIAQRDRSGRENVQLLETLRYEQSVMVDRGVELWEFAIELQSEWEEAAAEALDISTRIVEQCKLNAKERDEARADADDAEVALDNAREQIERLREQLDEARLLADCREPFPWEPDEADEQTAGPADPLVDPESID